MAEKDRPEIQQARLRRLLQKIQPRYVMEFKDPSSHFLNFRIDDEKGKPVAALKADYHSSVIADMSDEQVEQIILRVLSSAIKT